MVQGQHMRFWFSGPQFESGQDHFLSGYKCCIVVKGYKKRQRQDSNLRLQRRSDFQSHALDHSATLSYEIIDSRSYRSQANFISVSNIIKYNLSMFQYLSISLDYIIHLVYLVYLLYILLVSFIYYVSICLCLDYLYIS